MPHYHVICSRPEGADFSLEADAADLTALTEQLAKSRPGCHIVSAVDVETDAKVRPAEEAEGRRVIAEKAAADAKAKAEADAKAADAKAHHADDRTHEGAYADRSDPSTGPHGTQG